MSLIEATRIGLLLIVVAWAMMSALAMIASVRVEAERSAWVSAAMFAVASLLAALNFWGRV